MVVFPLKNALIDTRFSSSIRITNRFSIEKCAFKGDFQVFIGPNI